MSQELVFITFLCYVITAGLLAVSWFNCSPRTAARLTLLYPFAPITLPLFLSGLLIYGIYFVIRTAVGGSTEKPSGGCGSW